MKDNNVYIGLGSNSHDSHEKLSAALCRLGEISGARIEKVSPLYLTEPQGYTGQPWFCNQVVWMRVDNIWEPATLLAEMLSIEHDLGRVRSDAPRFGPRPIDLDLLLYGDIYEQSETCIVPHPRMTTRAFVLVPLLDIAPDIKVMGKSGREWLVSLDWHLEGNRIFQKS